MSAPFDYSFDNGVTWTHCAIGSFIVPGIRTVLIKYAGPAKRATLAQQAAPDAMTEAQIELTLQMVAQGGITVETAKRKLLAAAPSSQAEPSASIDTPEFAYLLDDYDRASNAPTGGEMSAAYKTIVAHIHAWGAALARPAPATKPATDETYMLKREIHNLKRHIEDYCPATEPAPDAANTGGLPDLWMHEDMARDETAAVVNLPRKELQAAYVQARGDLACWMRRALEAEAQPRPDAVDALDVAAVRNAALEEAARVLEGGSFMHDEAPGAILAREAAKAIRAKKSPATTGEP